MSRILFRWFELTLILAGIAILSVDVAEEVTLKTLIICLVVFMASVVFSIWIAHFFFEKDNDE
jgi:multisubunit Na+/H+ antiporter MnhG subunit